MEDATLLSLLKYVVTTERRLRLMCVTAGYLIGGGCSKTELVRNWGLIYVHIKRMIQNGREKWRKGIFKKKRRKKKYFLSFLVLHSGRT